MLSSFSLILRFRLLLLMEFALLLALLWPGFLSSDSEVQRQIALSGLYGDHHPPMLSVIWGLFLPLYDTPAWMLGLHLIIMALGVDYLARIHQYKPLAFLALLIPFVPQVLIYLGCIWKDVAMAVSFFTLASILSLHTFRKTKPTGGEILSLCLLMAYGASVKYQGQFLALPFCFWFFYLHHKTMWGWFIKSLMLGSSLLIFVQAFNSYFIPAERNTHAWQYVKLFDLAAISVACNQDFIPTSYKTALYTFAEIKVRANHQRVDDLVFGEEAVLKISLDDKDHQLLQRKWLEVIFSHPFTYLAHRVVASSYIYGSIPGYSHYLNLIQPLTATHPLLFKALNILGRGIGLFVLAHLLIPFFTLFYIYLGIRQWKRSAFAPIIFFLSLASLTLIGVLFFMSMAGTPRYTYVCTLLIAQCHLMAFFLYKERKKQLSLHDPISCVSFKK